MTEKEIDLVGRTLELNRMRLDELLVVTDALGIKLSDEERTQKASVIRAIIDIELGSRRAIPKAPSKVETWVLAQKVDWTDVSLVGAALFFTFLALPLGFFALLALIPLTWHIVRSVKEVEQVWAQNGRYAWFKAISLMASIAAALTLVFDLIGWAAGANLWPILILALAWLGFDLYTEIQDEQLKKVQPPKNSEAKSAEEKLSGEAELDNYFNPAEPKGEK